MQKGFEVAMIDHGAAHARRHGLPHDPLGPEGHAESGRFQHRQVIGPIADGNDVG